MSRRIEHKFRHDSLCPLGAGVSWDAGINLGRSFDMRPPAPVLCLSRSLIEWPNRMAHAQEKTENSTPYWSVTAFL